MSTHKNTLTKYSAAAIATSNLLVGIGGDSVPVINATMMVPFGVCLDTANEAGEPVAVHMLGATNETVEIVAGEAISVGSFVFSGADGKATRKPNPPGHYYQIGRALTEAAADGDIIEVEPCFPVQITVS